MTKAQADSFYVSTSGNDQTGTGSQSNPWRSIAKACNTVPAGAHTINIGEGTFSESEVMKPKEGVSIKGAGVDATIIRFANMSYNFGAITLRSDNVVKNSKGTPVTFSFNWEGINYTYDKKTSVAGNQEISNLTIDGVNKAGYEGIRVVNRNNVKIHDIKIQYFKSGGIVFETQGHATMKNLEVYNFKIKESGYEGTDQSLGNITVRGDYNGLNIHDGTIEHLNQGSGYGMKFLRCWEDYGRRGDYARNVKIKNLIQKGKPNAEWAGGLASNIAIEFWNIASDGVELANSTLSNGISMEFNAPLRDFNYSFWVHHNSIKVPYAGIGETACSNIIFEYNYIDYRENTNAWCIFGEFNSGNNTLTPGVPIRNIRVNNNIFDMGTRQPSIFVFTSKFENIQFYNNTINATGGRITMFEARRSFANGSNSCKVKNNIFDFEHAGSFQLFINGGEGFDGGAPANSEFKNNIFRTAPTSISSTFAQSSNIVGTAQLARSGSRSTNFFKPTTNSNVINAGVNVGLPFAGPTPDLGALETGSVVVPTPVNNAPSISILTPVNNITADSGSDINFTVDASDSDGTVKKVEYFNGSTKLGESTTSPFSFTWTSPANGTYTLTATATDNGGALTTSGSVVVIVQAPVVVTPPAPGSTFYRAINLNGTAIVLDGNNWEGSNAGNYTITGIPWASPDVNLSPATNANRTDMIHSFIGGSSPSIKFTSVPAGNYQVYVYLWEDNIPQSHDLYVQGQKVLEDVIVGGAGAWKKYGPYSTTVTDNTITISGNDGAPNISGIEIYSNSSQPANKAPQVALTTPTNNATVVEGSAVNLAVAASDSDGTISKVEYFNGITKVGQTTMAPFSVTWTNPTAGTYTLTAKAFDNAGASTISAPVTLKVKAKTTPPSTATFYRAINLNGEATTLDGNSWAGSSASNYTYTATTFTNSTTTLNPVTDAARTAMIRSSIWSGNVSLTLTSVPTDDYDVYLYVWEDNSTETYSISLEGKVVKSGYNSGSAGTWAKLGPFTANIADGTINVTTTGGAANISGIEVWKSEVSVSATVAKDINISTCGATGTILREYWSNISGSSISSVPVQSAPTSTSILTSFEAPSNLGSNYGTRISGYICPPVTGAYTFWIAGDDNCELYLSTSDNPSAKVKIAYVSGYSDAREWNKYAEQQSTTIILEAGKKYYIEALHKQGYGSDHVSVGWELPNGQQEMPIAGSHLAPYTGTTSSPIASASASTLVAYPNPVADETTLQFEVVADQEVRIAVSNTLGIQVLTTTYKAATGENRAPLNVSTLPTGSYVVALVKDGKTITQKLMIVK
jgi:hypothetical protein